MNTNNNNVGRASMKHSTVFPLTVKDLREYLSDLPNDFVVVLSVDGRLMQARTVNVPQDANSAASQVVIKN